MRGEIRIPIGPGPSGGLPLAGRVSAPRIALSQPPLMVPRARTTVRLSGVATDDGRVRDLVISVIPLKPGVPARKAFYLAAPHQGATPRRLPFSATVKLPRGLSFIQITARDRTDVVGRRRFAIYRR